MVTFRSPRAPDDDSSENVSQVCRRNSVLTVKMIFALSMMRPEYRWRCLTTPGSAESRFRLSATRARAIAAPEKCLRLSVAPTGYIYLPGCEARVTGRQLNID